MMRKIGLLAILILGCLYLHAKTYLVSVGIADYPGTRNDLRISDNDAKTIANVFHTTKDAIVRVLVNKDATRSSLLSSMQALFSNAQGEDAVILYFSGHGTLGALECYDGGLHYYDIVKVLRKSEAQRKIIIADACYAGKMRAGKQQSTQYTSENIMFFLSSRTNEKSRETKYKNSLFTIFLERGLRGGADTNKNRSISAHELFEFVHDGVVEASGKKQHPVMWGKFDNEMTVINW